MKRRSLWTKKEQAVLRKLFAAASDAELAEALPRHGLRAIRSRAFALGLRRASAVRPSVRERQRRRMDADQGYLARRVAELGAAAFARPADDVASSAAIECLIAAAATIHARNAAGGETP